MSFAATLTSASIWSDPYAMEKIHSNIGDLRMLLKTAEPIDTILSYAKENNIPLHEGAETKKFVEGRYPDQFFGPGTPTAVNSVDIQNWLQRIQVELTDQFSPEQRDECLQLLHQKHGR